jgi:hypothetical protein
MLLPRCSTAPEWSARIIYGTVLGCASRRPAATAAGRRIRVEKARQPSAGNGVTVRLLKRHAAGTSWSPEAIQAARRFGGCQLHDPSRCGQPRTAQAPCRLGKPVRITLPGVLGDHADCWPGPDMAVTGHTVRICPWPPMLVLCLAARLMAARRASGYQPGIIGGR